MIIESILNIIFGLFNFVFSLLPTLPKLPDISSPFDGFKLVVSKGLRLLGVFLDVSLFKPFVLIVIGIIIFRRLYFVIDWVLTRIWK